jgi:hypothetical protein
MSFFDNAQNALNKAKTAIMDALPHALTGTS